MQIQRTQNTPNYRPAFEKLQPTNWKQLNSSVGKKACDGLKMALGSSRAKKFPSPVRAIADQVDSLLVYGQGKNGIAVSISNARDSNTGELNVKGLSALDIAAKLPTFVNDLYKGLLS